MPSSYAYMYIYVMYTLHVIYMNKPPDSQLDRQAKGL